jgi:acetolactate synthase-1/3 small subunit
MTATLTQSNSEVEAKTEDLDPLHTLSVYVANKPGVLARIAQVFARRAFNIESLVVSAAIDGTFSRMTIGVRGNPEGLGQIIAQLNKLVDTIRCTDHTGDDAVVREMALVKITCTPEERSEALQIVEHFGCKTVDLTPRSMTVMATGASEKVDAFVNMIRKFEVVEQVRTGRVVMARGEDPT